MEDVTVIAHEGELDAAQVEAMADVARKWLASPEGQAKMREGMDRADAMIARLCELRRVNPEDLRRRVTI